MTTTQTDRQVIPQVEFRNSIVRLGAGGDSDILGGKGAGLDRLVKSGLPVPPGFVLTPDAFQAVLRANGRDPEGSEGLGDRVSIPGGLLEEIMRAVADLGAEVVAVRSSVVGEDGTAHSFAGQYESTLSVPADDSGAISDALWKTWNSLFSDHAVAYRERVTGEKGIPKIAVVVQAMVDADVSGVLFTVDPVGRQSGKMIVNVVPGLGDRMVAGEVTPTEYSIDRTSAETGLSDADPLVDPENLAGLRDLALQIEKIGGGPQDIEFAIAGREIAILQARPITAIGRGTERFDDLADVTPVPIEVVPPESGFWELSAKDFQRPITPLTMDIYVPEMSAAIAAFFNEFGILLDGMEMRSIGGHPYARMIPPGGKDGAPPPAFLMKLLFRLVPMLRSKLKASRMATENRLDQHYVNHWYGSLRPEVDEWLSQSQNRDLSTPSERELVGLLEETRGWLTRTFRAHFQTLPAHFLSVSDLYLFVEKHLGWSKEKIGRLTYGISTETSAGTQMLGRMGEVATELLGAPPADIEELEGLCDSSEEFAGLYDSYVDRWGLVIRSYDFDSPVEAEDRRTLLEQILSYAAAGYDPAGLAEEMADRRRKTEAEARESLGEISPDLQNEFDRLLEALQTGFPIRDDTGLMAMRAMGVTRLVAMELGRRLVNRSLLERPEHVVFLTVQEIREGVQEGTDWRDAVRRRRGERKWAEMNPGPASYGEDPGDPPSIDTLPKDMHRIMRGVMWLIENDLSPSIPRDEEGGINGIPASAGTVVGRVRVLRDVRDFGSLGQGDILVCPVTTPAWASAFPVIGGVITDFGGVLSHPAIIAREFGVPAVVGTGTATSILHDGDLVRLDGTTGRVEILGTAD